MYKITITLPTCNRLIFLTQCIESLKIAFETCMFEDFKKNITLVISCEPYQEIIDYVNKIDWINKTILTNEKILGVRENPYKVLNYVFDNGSIFNLHIESDLIFSKHLINLFYYYYNYQYDNHFIYGFFHHNKNTAGKFENIYDLYITNYFFGLGWACSNKSWNEIKNIWFINPYEKLEGWDYSLYHYCLNLKKKCLSVKYPYTKHIGVFGVHVTPDINDKLFNYIILYNEKEFCINNFVLL